MCSYNSLTIKKIKIKILKNKNGGSSHPLGQNGNG
jgi:hypothetical protein